MKIFFLLAALLFYILPAQVFGQYITNPSSIGLNDASFSTCGTNQFCDYNYIGGEIKMYIDRISGNTAYFRVVKCAATVNPLYVPQFTTTGYVFIKSGSLCGTIEGQVVLNGSATYAEIAVPLNSSQSLTNYYAVYIPNYNPSNPYGSYARYNSGAIQITGPTAGSSNLYMYENIAFSTSTMDVFGNNPFTFKIANSGNSTWNGSIYMVFSTGSTIDLGSWSVQPGYINFCNSCYFIPGLNDIGNINAEIRFQTNGTGSAVRIPSQVNANLTVRPIAPILISPANTASIGSGSNINFTWNTNGNPSGVFYSLRVRNTTDNIVVFDQNVGSAASYSLASSYFTVGKTYQWIVTATKGFAAKEAFPANTFTILGQPNLTIGSNVNFGTTTLYSGVNYTGNFSVTNSGSAPWSGSMYVVLTSGATLNAGSATINPGNTQAYSVSYTPNITASNVGVSASYQTGGSGSGITVPNQNANNVNIVGNLGVTGNAVNPASGTQNSTNFTFTANLSNVAPSPTLAPVVGLEFIAPDGITYTTTNIPNTSGNTYSKTQTLQQAGNYQYRYIAYQSTRPNAATGWRTMTVSSQPTITIGSLPASMVWNCNQNITWTSSPGIGNVTIELVNASDNSTKSVLADNIANNGTFVWTVGKDNNNLNIQNFTGGSYKIKMYPTGTSGQGVTSNSSFTIVTPTITLSQPTATNYFKGTNMNIAWGTSSNLCGPLTIEYTNTSNTTLGVIISNTPNDGSHIWAIPSNFADGSYKIKIYMPVSSGASPVLQYSATFTVGTDPNCPNCLPSSVTVAQFTQTGQEGFCASQYLCGKGILDNNVTTSPTAKILRQDLAKVALLSVLADNQIVTVKNGGGSFPADYYPTTFTDLFQGTATSYHRYAKILSYLQGSDNTVPFDRNKPDPNNPGSFVPRLNFEPTGFITRADLVKVFLETWNIDETTASNVAVPYTDISSLPVVTQNYIRRAFQLGIIASQTSFRPNDDATREEAFLMLARMRQNLTLPPATYLTSATNYYQPANQSIGNLSIYKGLTQGNFSHHTSTDFGINDIGFSLNFAHSYQSFMTMLPDEFKLVQPLGYGWTHPYNVYLFTTVQINDANGAVAAKPLLVLAWGDGTMDVYDNTNVNSPTPITIGTNYNVLTRVSSTQYTIKTKSQHIYTFNTQGSEAGLFRLTNIKDRYNNTLSIVYKVGASVPWTPSTMVIDYVQAPSGRRINFTYDTQNRITNVNFPGSNSNTRNLTFAYTNKNLTSFKDAKGQSTGKTTTYSYGTGTEIYLLKQIAFPRGNKIENVYDPNSRLRWTQARDASNNITAKTDMTGGYGAFNTDGSVTNNWTQDCSCPNSQSSAKYNNNGITTEFQNKVIKVLSPASANHPSMPSTVTYSALNGSSPQTYTPTYDSNGNVLSISRPDGKSESFTYDAYHNRRTHTDAKNITTTYNWSADGKFLNSIVRPIGNGSNLTQSFGYLTNGLMSNSTNNENIATNFGYDTRGNMNLIQIPILNISSSAVYDFASRMTSNTNARGKTTTYIFDDNDNLTRETDPLSRQTNYGYDDNDNLLTITNAKNEVTTLGYDGFDRLISETFGGKTKTYIYDNSQNRLVEFRKAGYANNNAKRFTYTYDANNRLYGNGYITEILYDPLNRMSSIKGGTQATHQLSNFSYDVLNRLTSYTDAWNNTVGYGYDDNGNETRIDYPNGNKLYKTYDNLNRLKTLTWNSTLVATYNYVGSRLDNVVYGNGVKTQYTYDNAARPTGISTKTNNGTGNTIYAATFVLDNLGNHTEENETQPFATLPVPTAGTTSSTFTNNRINNLGSISFTHDDDGNITAKGSSTYGYDLEDNLTSFTGSGLTMTALYDAFGNRRSVSRNGTETRYVLDINGLYRIGRNQQQQCRAKLLPARLGLGGTGKSRWYPALLPR